VNIWFSMVHWPNLSTIVPYPLVTDGLEFELVVMNVSKTLAWGVTEPTIHQ
jgi:hypothetical protein